MSHFMPVESTVRMTDVDIISKVAQELGLEVARPDSPYTMEAMDGSHHYIQPQVHVAVKHPEDTTWLDGIRFCEFDSQLTPFVYQGNTALPLFQLLQQAYANELMAQTKQAIEATGVGTRVNVVYPQKAKPQPVTQPVGAGF